MIMMMCLSVCLLLSVCVLPDSPTPTASAAPPHLHGLCSRSVDSFVLCEMTFIVFSFSFRQNTCLLWKKKVENSKKYVQKNIK